MIFTHFHCIFLQQTVKKIRFRFAGRPTIVLTDGRHIFLLHTLKGSLVTYQLYFFFYCSLLSFLTGTSWQKCCQENPVKFIIYFFTVPPNQIHFDMYCGHITSPNRNEFQGLDGSSNMLTVSYSWL